MSSRVWTLSPDSIIVWTPGPLTSGQFWDMFGLGRAANIRSRAVHMSLLYAEPKAQGWAALLGHLAHLSPISLSLSPPSQGDRIPPSPPIHASWDGVHGRCHVRGLLSQHRDLQLPQAADR